MVRSRDTTVTTLDVTGLKPAAAHMVHVHEQSCANGNGGAHFRFDTDLPFSEENEIWLPFTSKADGTSGEVVDQRPARRLQGDGHRDPRPGQPGQADRVRRPRPERRRAHLRLGLR